MVTRKRNFCAGIVLTGVAAAGLIFLGCESTPNDGDGNGAEYNLVVVLEKNLDINQDMVYVRFRKDDIGIPGAVVVVDGDTIATSSASGRGDKTYLLPRWLPAEQVQIRAVDAAGSFVYRDSVVIPGAFAINAVVPANRLWRPSDANAEVSWTTSANALGYVVSAKARTISTSSNGFGDYAESQSSLTQVVPPQAFKDDFDNVIEDVYDLKIVAYNPNFIIERSQTPPYKLPETDDIREPISGDNIDGAIAASVVCEKDTLMVQTL